MFDTPPDDKDGRNWFHYFRLTKYLPAMSQKFDRAMNAAQDAEAARVVMTAYAAAAIDTLIFLDTPPREMAAELKEMFELTPQHLLLLSADDIARFSGRSELTVNTCLADAGFKVDGGIVVGFAPKSDTSPQPRRLRFRYPKP